MVRELLLNGADIDVQNQYGKTPLHCAVLECHFEMVKLLLEHDSDYSLCYSLGKTPKIIAMELLKGMVGVDDMTINNLHQIVNLLDVYEACPDIKEPDQ
jgi:ankyrin repeat protein